MAKRKTVASDVVIAVTDLLTRAMLAAKHVAEAQKDLGEQREGAYSLYVKAAIAAKSDVVLSDVSDTLFEQIRKTGTLNGTSLGCAANKDGGFKIPMSFSAAKSIMVKALSCNIPLVDDKKKQRSYTAIRKDVFAANAAQAEAEAEEAAKALTGVEGLRANAGKKVLIELADLIQKEENEKDLQDLLNRVSDAMRDYGYIEEETPEVVREQSEVSELVEEAHKANETEEKPKKRRSRKAA